MFEERGYQTQAVATVTRWLYRGKFRKCLSSPTGSGKTVVMMKLLQLPFRQIVFSHRNLLLQQISDTLTKAGIRHGFRASGRPSDPDANIQLAMIQTEVSRLGNLLGKAKDKLEAAKATPKEVEIALRNVALEATFDADLVHIDELHCQGGPTYRSIFSNYWKKGGSLLGYTATPGSLGNLVEDVHTISTVPELIESGHVCRPVMFSCGQPDPKVVEGLKTDANGDFSPKQLDKIVKPPIMIGSVIKFYRQLKIDGRAFVLAAHSVKASIYWAQHLTFNGIPTAHIDGDDVYVDGEFFQSDTEKRKEVFDRLKSGDLEGVSNRFVLREGFDCSVIGHAILTAPIGSRRSYVQFCGRALRPYPGREYAIIQDHSGSCLRHPRLDSAYPWDWQAKSGLAERQYVGKMKSDEEPEQIMCPQCNCLRNAGPVCPHCGFRYAKHSCYVIQKDGELRLVEGRNFINPMPRPKPNDDKIWNRIYWKTVKNGERTAEQAYSYFAFQNNWRRLSRNLPLMPKYASDWFLPLSKVPDDRLIKANSNQW